MLARNRDMRMVTVKWALFDHDNWQAIQMPERCDAVSYVCTFAGRGVYAS